jgi:PTS system mannose-specific IID component
MILELQLILLAWGTLVGLDLVSVPQMMIARPIVAGPIAGALLGDVRTGLELGVLFELFQYDILPVGAVRYPEYGPATIVAVSAAHGAAGTLGLGLGALVGLITGMAGGMSLHVVRRMNARAVQRAGPALEAGDPRALEWLHATSILRDAARAALVTALGLGRRGRGAGGGHGGDAAPRGTQVRPALVRGGRARRDGGGVAAMSEARRTRPPLGRTLLRLFTVQGSWNYERMQGVGMGVAEEPLLRDLRVGGDGGAYRGAVARGAHFFNAHPYLCGLAVGAAARAEHDGVPPEQVERLRTALCGPLGSLGDRLVWAGWLPLTSSLALIGVALGLGLPAILAFLVIYNAGHVALRWWALRAGWRYGSRVAVALREPLLQRATVLVGPAMALAVGAALPLVAQYLSGAFLGWWRAALAVVAAGSFALLWWGRATLTGLRLGLVWLAVAALAGWLWP